MDFRLNLDREPVVQAFSADSFSVPPTQPVSAVLRQMKEGNRPAVMICQDRKLIGIFTERDALRLMASGAELDVPVERVMTRNPVTLRAGDSMKTAVERMSTGGYRRLPIVNDEGVPLGLLNVAGILHFLVEHFPKIVYTLPPQPHHSTSEREGA